MRQILSLSHLAFMGLSHKKIYFVGLSIGALLTLLSLLLGPLGFEEEKRLSINFGLAGAQVGAIFLAVLSGATLLKDEIENQSAFIFLSKDVSRSQYLLSKFLGFVVSLIVTLGILSGFFFLTSFFTGLEWSFKIFIPFVGIFIEALVFFSFALLLSLLTSSLLTVALSFCFFLITHSIQKVAELMERHGNPLTQTLSQYIPIFIPEMGSLDWKRHLTYGSWEDPYKYNMAIIYGLSFVIIYLSISAIIFNKKDLS